MADARELERLLSDARAEIDVLRQSEAKFRAAFETMIEACCVFDMIYDDFGRPVDWRIVEANAGYEQQSGLKDVAGRLASEFMPGTEPYWIEMFGRVVETGVAEQIEKWHQPTGRWVHSSTARVGGSGSRRLVSVFYDITERKRAEIALRESENRFQQFANASSSGLWIRDAETLRMEFVSPSIATIYGTEPDALLGDIKYWAAMVLPEDRETAGHHIAQACHGDPAIHEFRIRRDDGSFRWIRDTDFPLFDENGNVQRVGGIAEDVTETKMAVEHQGVLLHELQHRVRNIMAVIRSMAVRSADGAADVEDYKTSLAGRLLALARVQTLLTRQANAGGWMRDILESEIGAQAHSENQYELTGPDIMLSPKAVEVLTLAFHELSTNALKYGALSVSRGKVTVTWTLFEKREKTWIAIDWVEEGAPSRAPPTRRGFGSELIEARIPYELRGTGKTTIEPEGARCHIEFPLREAESILETDAPVPTRLYGGTVDMTGAPDLSGKTILVVEATITLRRTLPLLCAARARSFLDPLPQRRTQHMCSNMRLRPRSFST